MARKSNTRLQESGKVRGVTNREIEHMKDSVRYISFNKDEEVDATED